MKAWCEQCQKYICYSLTMNRVEPMEIKGVRFDVEQTFDVCPVCGGDALSNALTDENIRRAHFAYMRAAVSGSAGAGALKWPE